MSLSELDLDAALAKAFPKGYLNRVAPGENKAEARPLVGRGAATKEQRDVLRASLGDRAKARANPKHKPITGQEAPNIPGKGYGNAQKRPAAKQQTREEWKAAYGEKRKNAKIEANRIAAIRRQQTFTTKLKEHTAEAEKIAGARSPFRPSNRQLAWIGAGATAATAGAAYLHHRDSVAKKAGDGHTGGSDALIGAASGAAGTHALLEGGGWAHKKLTDDHRRKRWNIYMHNKTWQQHLAEYKTKNPGDLKEPHKTEFYRKYPLNLPGGRSQRVGAWTVKHHPELVVGGAVAAGTAAYLHHKHAEQKVSKAQDQLRRQKKTSARLSTASAVIGLGTLGAKGASVGVHRFVKPTRKAERIASHIDRHLSTALIVGTGIGAAGALNSARINRAEAKQGRLVVVGKPPKQEVRKAVQEALKTGFQDAHLAVADRHGSYAAHQAALSGADRIAHKLGAASHDFREGVVSSFLTKESHAAGRYTSPQTAVVKPAYTAGRVTRYAAPAAGVGGVYVVARKAGKSHMRHKMERS